MAQEPSSRRVADSFPVAMALLMVPLLTPQCRAAWPRVNMAVSARSESCIRKRCQRMVDGRLTTRKGPCTHCHTPRAHRDAPMANDEHVALLKKGVDAWNAWRDKNPNIL